MILGCVQKETILVNLTEEKKTEVMKGKVGEYSSVYVHNFRKVIMDHRGNVSAMCGHIKL